jgi:uroporphyrinogen-III synthase
MRKRSLKLALAKAQRHEPTAAEAAAWALLRNRHCLGLKFRRQHVVRGFIVDFFCPELRLAVEIDGAVHCDRMQAEFDEARSRTLAVAGIGVVRIRNEQVSQAGLIALLEPYVTASLSQTSPAVPPP